MVFWWTEWLVGEQNGGTYMVGGQNGEIYMVGRQDSGTFSGQNG